MKVSPLFLFFAIFLGSILSNFSLFGQTKISLACESASPLMMLSHPQELAREETSEKVTHYSTEKAEPPRSNDTSLNTRDHPAIMREEEKNDLLDEIDLTEPPKQFDRFVEAAYKYPTAGRLVLSADSELIPQEASTFSRIKQLYRGGNENNQTIFRLLKTALAEYGTERTASLLSSQEEASILKNGLSAYCIKQIHGKLASNRLFPAPEDTSSLPSFSDISDIEQAEDISWPDSDSYMLDDTTVSGSLDSMTST